MKQLSKLSVGLCVRKDSQLSVTITCKGIAYKGNILQAIAIILDTLIDSITDASIPHESFSVRSTDKALKLILKLPAVTNGNLYPEYSKRIHRIANAVATAMAQVYNAGYLRYSEEVAAEIIKQKYNLNHPFLSIEELLTHFSYSPEIQMFIRMLYVSLIAQ